MKVVLVHGAFRGGWSLQPVVDGLAARGVDAVAPDLPGAGERYDASHPSISLQDQVDDLWRYVDGPTVLVGHSQGGLVARALVASDPPEGRSSDDVALVGYLDALVPGAGQSALDLLVLPDDLEPPARDAWLDPPPRADDDPIGARLTPAPASTGVDRLPDRLPTTPVAYAFLADTPPVFPAAVTRAALASAGVPFEVVPGGHDAPFLTPGPVIDWVVRLVDAVTAAEVG